jgi:CheY-like chemotaxis protein
MESLAHILVVDDHREIRDLLAKYLAKHGFRVSAAESAAKARRLLEASGGRVMPGTCGRTCTRWSLCLPAGPRTGNRAGHPAEGRMRGATDPPGSDSPDRAEGGLFLPRDRGSLASHASTHAGTA